MSGKHRAEWRHSYAAPSHASPLITTPPLCHPHSRIYPHHSSLSTAPTHVSLCPSAATPGVHAALTFTATGAARPVRREATDSVRD